MARSKGISKLSKSAFLNILCFLDGKLIFSQGERFIGSITAIKARAPVLGGNFGVWGGLFSTYDCAVKSIRQKEDPWKYVFPHVALDFPSRAMFLEGG